MTTTMIVHEVEDGEAWAKAWHKGPGGRHEMFGKLGVTVRTFRDPANPNLAGVLLDVPDMAQFNAFMGTEEAQAAMREDGLKADSLRTLTEFTA